MYSFLPDELLKEILAPALQVPDDAFASTEGRSPFSNYTKTTSAYLLVCKDWLRVATPLLYSVVVLRSRAQIQALEFALESTPELAGFIKKLRIESGYCSSLLKILKWANRSLSDLCLSLEVYSSDNVSGVCKGFALIQPKRLIIYDLERSSNKAWNQKAQQLLRTIYEYIGIWQLKTVVLPEWKMYFIDENTKIEDFVDALCTSESLEVVSILPLYRCPNWFDRLAKIPTLKQIVVRGSRAFETPFVQYLKKNPKFDGLVRFSSDQPRIWLSSSATKEIQGRLSPKPKAPRDWLNLFPDSVWTKIISCAMGIPELEEDDFSRMQGPFSYCYGPRFRRGLVCVCQKFKELGIPLYYKCIVITYDRELQSLSNLLSRREELGKQITSFFTVDQSHGAFATQNLNHVLPYMPNLQRISTNLTQWNANISSDIFDWQAFTTLSQTAGDHLVDLAIHLHRPTQPKTPDVIYGFTALRHLDFASSARFMFDSAVVDKDALGNLESVTCTSINNTFLSLLTCLDLPNIRNARFPVLDKCEGAITFLRKHGQKLCALEVGFLPGVSVFDICPGLGTFQVPCEKPGFAVAEFFSSTHVHPLKFLDVKTEDVAKGAEKEKFKYIGSLDLSSFPSLSRVKVISCEWPTTEHGIRKSHWVIWAERLKEKYDVDIVDKNGQNWTPRLRTRREQKQHSKRQP